MGTAGNGDSLQTIGGIGESFDENDLIGTNGDGLFLRIRLDIPTPKMYMC